MINLLKILSVVRINFNYNKALNFSLCVLFQHNMMSSSCLHNKIGDLTLTMPSTKIVAVKIKPVFHLIVLKYYI